jgi:hypothetical protein
MDCPLRVAAWLHRGGSIKDPPVKCGQVNCGWWDEDHGRCSIVTIARMADFIHKDVAELADSAAEVCRK